MKEQERFVGVVTLSSKPCAQKGGLQSRLPANRWWPLDLRVASGNNIAREASGEAETTMQFWTEQVIDVSCVYAVSSGLVQSDRECDQDNNVGNGVDFVDSVVKSILLCLVWGLPWFIATYRSEIGPWRTMQFQASEERSCGT
jgi:hypothetical protein